MLHHLRVRVVLEAEVSGERTTFIISPGIHKLAIDSKRIVRSDAGQLVIIPFTDRLERQCHGAAKRIKGSRAVLRVSRFGFANLKFVAAPHRYPGIIARLRETEKEARIGVLTFLPPFAPQHKIGKYPVRVPPEAHAAVTGCDALLQREAAGARLRPAIGWTLAEQRRKAAFVLRLSWDVLEQFRRNRVYGSRFK